MQVKFVEIDGRGDSSIKVEKLYMIIGFDIIFVIIHCDEMSYVMDCNLDYLLCASLNKAT